MNSVVAVRTSELAPKSSDRRNRGWSEAVKSSASTDPKVDDSFVIDGRE
jgi:hypothetical protein